MNAQGQVSLTTAPVWLREGPGRGRFGFKGAGAAVWCEAQGLPLPAKANTAAELDRGDGLLGRLAYTEFYVEHADPVRIDTLCADLGSGARSSAGGVYPVHRRDACILLGGPAATDVFLQTCNVNFAAIDLSESPLLMTLVVGVAVLVFPRVEHGQVVYRLVYDPTFAPYLWSTLREIVTEFVPTHPSGITRTS
ncbi:MAG: hypothetical protein ABIN37_05065 [Burkholderiaceae bacterium]